MKKKTNVELETENKMLREEVESLRKMVMKSLESSGVRWQWFPYSYSVPYVYTTSASSGFTLSNDASSFTVNTGNASTHLKVS